MIEKVCKYILDESKSHYEDGAELSVIYKSACGLLNFSPDQHTQPIFKQILSGCFSVVNGLGSIRNKISDAHGISENRIRPTSRHAGLVVNLSDAVCQFLLDSLREKRNNQLATIASSPGRLAVALVVTSAEGTKLMIHKKS